MRVWRLCRRRFAAFDGEGARRFGGRWSPRGMPAIYVSGAASLATLEYFVHLDLEDAPPDLVLIPADVPDGLAIDEVSMSALPRTWRRTPAPEALARLGAVWMTSGRTAVLSVPSALVPVERNYLLNSAHPEFSRIVVGRPQRFGLDRRLVPHR